MGTAERSAWIGGGTLLVLSGLRRGGLLGLLLASAGSGLLYSGIAGRSPLRLVTEAPSAGAAAERVGTAARRLLPAVAGRARPTRFDHSVTIGRPREELYRFWRDFANLPRVMPHLERVEVRNDRDSHWVARAPGGGTVEWDAEVTEDRLNEAIGWRSVGQTDVPNEGVVRFRDAPGDRGTEVTAELRYEPPGGTLGRGIAKLFGEEPEQQVRDALRRFKQVMEAGEVATIARQPVGRGQQVPDAP